MGKGVGENDDATSLAWLGFTVTQNLETNMK